MSEELVEVRNLVGNTVGYKLESTGRRIVFQPFEKKKLPLSDIQELNYQRGGQVLLRDYLSVEAGPVREDIEISKEQIEYDWTKEDVDNVLLNGSMDELADALDFGPAGIVELIKARAVDLRIPDANKRQIIQQKTGADIDRQIHWADEAAKAKAKVDEDSSVPKKPSQRRVQSK